MSVIDQLASVQGRKDDLPNQMLAKQLAAEQDAAGIQMLVDRRPVLTKSQVSRVSKVINKLDFQE